MNWFNRFSENAIFLVVIGWIHFQYGVSAYTNTATSSRIQPPILVDAFRIPSPSSTAFYQRLSSTSPHKKRSISLFASNNQQTNMNEFDYLLGEFDQTTGSVHQNIERQHRRMVQLPSSTRDNQIVLVSSSSSFAGASSPFAASNIYDETDQQQQDVSGSPSAVDGTTDTVTEGNTQSDDPYANAFDSQLGKVKQFQEKQSTNTLENKLKSMDLQDIVLTLFIPGLLTFVAGRYVFQKVSTKVTANTDAILDSFANEMIYHDGDYKEMELCYKDYSKRLLYMGPLKSDAMIKRYLEVYSKKKTASPQAIVSLSYVFTIFQLSEEKAANTLVQLCHQMGTSKISSIGKLFFLGTRILKSDAGIKALQPIKALIMSTYRDERVAETLVETSQQLRIRYFHSEMNLRTPYFLV
jgi:hypothetical protein